MNRYHEQDNTANSVLSLQRGSQSLIVWGCGEFGQHGLLQSGDVTLELAIRKFAAAEHLLPTEELPFITVCGSSHTLILTGI